MSTPAIRSIRFDHVSISVADLDAQIAWYQQDPEGNLIELIQPPR
jgi:catechol-2,3-dioxygenase